MHHPLHREHGILGFLLCASVVGGCATDGTSPADPAPLPQTSGTYAGAYRVPTADALAAAATFAVDSVEWTVAGGVATLHYNLPRGLVGGTLDVTLAGALAPGSTAVALTGASGTGHCVATATTVTCNEVFGDLGTLPISMDVVMQVAATEYAGPAADRAAVAGIFGSDPIGTVELDLATPVIDDHGGAAR